MFIEIEDDKGKYLIETTGMIIPIQVYRASPWYQVRLNGPGPTKNLCFKSEADAYTLLYRLQRNLAGVKIAETSSANLHVLPTCEKAQ